MIFEKEEKSLTLEEFEKLTGVKWISRLEFGDPAVRAAILKQGQKLHKKGEMTLEQMWLGKYFQKEILLPYLPDIAIRWIDPILGWGVFALRAFKKMEFIAEYVGEVRKRKKEDEKNAYCFEYIIAPGIKSPYLIDALDQGGVARYINHSFEPNLFSNLAVVENMAHVIFYTKEPIAKGAQLCYDYGLTYWSKRTKPVLL
jgi:hypothetical protein